MQATSLWRSLGRASTDAVEIELERRIRNVLWLCWGNTMAANSIMAHFEAIRDPRIERTKKHQLQDILAITICAVICGADDWVSIAQFARDKKA